MLTDITRLTESPGEMKKRPDGAQYHDGESIITHLNYSLMPWGWDWEELENGIDTETDEVWVLGRLTARFVVESFDGGEVERVTSKTERGWQKINRLRDGSAKSPGDDRKGADTDALKRAARLLGVGLDAWAKAPQKPAQRPAQKPKPAAEPVPQEPKTDSKPCDSAFYNRKWHASVKDTRFADEDVRGKFIAWYSDNATDSLTEWLKDATEDEADALIATVLDRIEREKRMREQPA